MQRLLSLKSCVVGPGEKSDLLIRVRAEKFAVPVDLKGFPFSHTFTVTGRLL